MNKVWLTVAIVFFVMAAALVVLNLSLPAESLMFMVGDVNRPWLAPVVAAVGGLIFLTMAVVEGRKNASGAPTQQPIVDPAKAALNKRLESIATGLFLVMLGGYLLVPHSIVAAGVWSIAVGLLMLGLNAARYGKGIRMSGFTTFLGIISVLGGILQLAGLEEIEGAFLLIILGAFLLLKPVFDKRQIFGKAEHA